VRRSRTWRQELSIGNVGALYVWVLIIAFFAFLVPHHFLVQHTISAVVNEYSISGLAALAVLVPMASGTFDASIGGNISLSSVICAYLLIHTTLSVPIVVLLTLAAGAALGLFNTLVVVGFGIPSLIGTLATWLIADALSVAISGNATISSARVSGSFSNDLSQASWAGFAIPMVYVAIITVLMGVFLSRTVSGRYVYAVGFNTQAARLAGIRVQAIQAGSLLCSGMVGAFAGIVLTAHLSSATPITGDSYLLPAFAAVFVGATQFSAKRFNALGTVIAVFMLGTGQYGLLVAGAPQWTPNVFQGLALVAAIGLTHLHDPNRTRRWRAAKSHSDNRTSGETTVRLVSESVPEVEIGKPSEALNGAPAASSEPVVIEIAGLSKTFPGQQALSDVSMRVQQDEIHALLGQNGSGKSTLIKVLAGIYTPDPGAIIRVCGEDLPFGSPRDSRRLGLHFVHQALGIIEELTAVENVALGFGYRHRAKFLIDWRAQRKKTRRLLEMLSVEFDIDRPVSQLRPVDRSAIAIARALDDDDGVTRVLVLDEPTAALPPHEVSALFSLVRQTRNSGTSVIYVSHRLNEIFELADQATVLRDGEGQGTFPVKDIDHSTLVQLIVGETELAPSEAAGVANASRVGAGTKAALRVNGLVAQRLNDLHFEVKVGEIVGVAGLTGSGREELAGALTGERPSQVELENADGRRCSNPTPRRAKQLGIVLVQPNRARGAATAEFTVRENMTLPSLPRYSLLGMISPANEVRDSKRWIDMLDIRPKDPDRLYALLSGGNQQKVIFGKWLNFGAKVMVIDDPTSGVDIAARKAIYELIRHQASQGVSFVVCSSDSDDLIAVCDRIIVLNEGSIVGELVGSEIEEAHLLTAMVGGDTKRSGKSTVLGKVE
jgi:ribose transport system ATP-binding protein